MSAYRNRPDVALDDYLRCSYTFAYGMNMSAATMDANYRLVGPAYLTGWGLEFDRFANVVRAGSRVPGVVWEILSVSGLRYLDQREGYHPGEEGGYYTREVLKVDMPWDEVETWVYHMRPEARNPVQQPCADWYYATMAAGREAVGLPTDDLPLRQAVDSRM
jgi:gamma-glutamylcyclotransferase (GGCT)/AIG2-like uncharacterized protein YtfP